jgi:nucleoside-diphosphate-sugar epimerase
MKVFVTGANGYIGFAVASRLAAKGHQVMGLVRSSEKARKIAAAEILPIAGDMNHPESYCDAARACELLIHCAADMAHDFHALDRKTVNYLIQIARESSLRRRLIYTSGVWLYGDTGNKVVTENNLVNPPRQALQRQETENIVLNANNHQLATISIRPGCVYGGSGSLTAGWFESAVNKGQAHIVGDGHFRWAMVHIEDLAELYVRASESYLSGEIFNGTDRSRFTVEECAQAANRAAGKPDHIHKISREEAEKTMGDLATCLMLNQHVDSSKAARFLNWQPRHGGFVDGVEQYFHAWQALND